MLLTLLAAPLLAFAAPVTPSSPHSQVWHPSGSAGGGPPFHASAPRLRLVNCTDNVPPALAQGLEFPQIQADPTLVNGIRWPVKKLGVLPDNMECGRIEVPVSHDASAKRGKPESIELAYMTLKATAEPRKGAIFFDPGGPQEAQSAAWSTISNLANVPDVGSQMFDELEHFDIITVDPRGYGQSNPPNCTEKVPDTSTFFITDEASFNKLLAPIRAFGTACKAQIQPPSLLDHMGAQEVASDYELVRRVLVPQEKFNYIGISYGTFWGAEYMKRFPEQQGRIVLDAVLAHGTTPEFSLNITVQAMNRLLLRADDWCLHNSTCPFFGMGKGAVPAVFKNVTEQAPRNVSIFAKQAFKELVFSNAEFSLFTSGFGLLAESVQTGNYSGLAPLVEQIQTFRGLNEQFGVSLPATMCTDIGIKDATFETFDNLKKTLKPWDPHGFLQASETWEILLMCAGYPVTPIPPSPAASAKPMLWVTSDYDLNTPTGWVDFARARTPQGVLVVRHGDDHGTFQLAPPTFPSFLPGRAEEVAFLANGTLPGRREGRRFSVLLHGDKRVIPSPYEAPIGTPAGDVDPATS